jgi:hypothetical protein
MTTTEHRSTVNPALTPNQPTAIRPTRAPRTRRTVVENDDYAAFVRRVITAYGRRIASGDIEGLATLAQLGHDLDDVLEHAIIGLRDSGFSWADIATRLGVSRQAAHQHWGGDQS